MDSGKLTSRSNSLELEILDLHLPALEDFSKVKVILSVNNYTQCLTYPFKTMTIPSVDDYSILEISILQQSSLLGSIEVPISLFKNKRSQTFKLLNASQNKKSSPSKQDNNEITLSIKFWANDSSVEEYKEQIRKLEQKVKESELKVGVELKNQLQMQENFEEITRNLSKMIKNQEDTIQNLINDKEKINEYLKKVEFGFRPACLEGRDVGGQGKFLDKAILQKKGTDRKRMKSFELSNREKLVSKQQFESFDKEYVKGLESELQSLKTENENLKNSLSSYQQKVDDLEFEVSEMSVSTSGEKTSDKNSNEGMVLNLRGQMARMASKYKARISKLIESRNTLIQENKALLQRNQELEAQLSSSQNDRSKSPSSIRPNSYKLLGKYANNIKKIENSLNKSPRLSNGEELNKYLQITPTSARRTPELRLKAKDPIDALLEEQSLLSQIKFIKESEGIYSFGSKRVFIKLENNKIFIRIGAGFMTLEEFLKVYLPLETDKINKTKELESRPLSKAREEKFVTCFGVQRRSASVTKLPCKTSRDFE